MMNVKTRTKSNIPEKNSIITKEDKIINVQKINERSKQTNPLSSSSKQFSINDQRQINDTDDMMDAIKNPTPSNISELTKTSTTTYEQSKPSTKSSKISHLLSQKEESNSITTRSRVENKDRSITNKQQPETSSIDFNNEQNVIPSSTYNLLSNQSISVPPKSRTASDILKRRSQSVSSSRKPSNVLSTISSSLPNSNQISHTSNPSTTESHLSRLTSKNATNSIRSENLTNQLSKTSASNKILTDSSAVLTKQKNFQRPELNTTDSTFNEYNSQPNNPNISA
jgi:hypothetical protein